MPATSAAPSKGIFASATYSTNQANCVPFKSLSFLDVYGFMSAMTCEDSAPPETEQKLSLAASLGVTQFTAISVWQWVTLCCHAQCL